MTIKLHECKHKHHHKHHHDDGISRINFQHDKVKSGDSVEVVSRGVTVARPEEEFVNSVNCSDDDDGELATLARLGGHDDKPRVAFLRGDNPKNASAQAACSCSSSVNDSQQLPEHQHQYQQNHLHQQQQQRTSSRSRSCSHPSSFNFKFYRYQFLRILVVLYITLVVVVANAVAGFEPDFVYPLENVTVAKGRDATFTCVVNNLGGYRVSGEATPARVCIGSLNMVSPSVLYTTTTTSHNLAPGTLLAPVHQSLT